MKQQAQKILIISLSGIGDLILFTPAIPLLRKRFPEAEISLLVKKKEAAKVLKGNPYIDKIIVFDPQKASIKENILFYFSMRKRKYDISLSTFPAMTFLNNLSTFAIGARKRWVYKTDHPLLSFDFLQNRRIPYQHGKHRIDYNLALVKALAREQESGSEKKPGTEDPIELETNPLDQVYIYGRGHAGCGSSGDGNNGNNGNNGIHGNKRNSRKYGSNGNGRGNGSDGRDERYGNYQKGQSGQILLRLGADPLELFIGIHAGSGDNQPFKRWGEEKFALLADKIQKEFPFRVILLGGPEEEELSRRVARHMATTPPVIAAGRTCIEETLALISRCELLISNDSGVMNMAFALRKKILAIFGPTDDTCTRPLGKNDVVILKEFPCKPACRKRYLYSKECNFGYRCLKELSVDEVWNVARGVLESMVRQE
ncbi:MAG: glycosyltransferase family 9 protein [bacterium]